MPKVLAHSFMSRVQRKQSQLIACNMFAMKRENFVNVRASALQACLR